VSEHDAAALPYVLAFRPGVALMEKEGERVLQWEGRALSLRAASPGILAVLEALSSGGASEQDLAGRAVEGGATGQAAVLYYLHRFKHLGVLTYTATWDGRRLATLIPTSRVHPAMPGEVARGARHALSRFACLRREDAHFVLDSPLGYAKTRLVDARASALCHLLAEPQTIEDLCREIPSLSPIAAAMLLGLLLGSGAAGAEGALDEALGSALATWSFHDLLFHTRSRRGRHDERYGATYPWKERLEPLPAVKPKIAGPVIPLPRPDIAALLEQDLPFTRVLEERRSIRAHDERPLDIGRIAHFLFRSARVRALRDRSEGVPYVATSRPYPGAGACYELEVYLVVGTCDGLDPGLYHYDPLGHALTMIVGPPRAAAALLDEARATMGKPRSPIHTLVVLAARFQRMSWKYESVAYATILKDVGALYQTMYLVATAMGLAPCALGGGDSDLFAEAAGLDYYAETSVGEFVLGSSSRDSSR
jgi:SagB-type dehydrogenase family enzyme